MKTIISETVPVFSRKIRERAAAASALCALGVAAASAQSFSYSGASATTTGGSSLAFNPRTGVFENGSLIITAPNSGGSFFFMTSSAVTWGGTSGGITFFSANATIDGATNFTATVPGTYSNGNFFAGIREHAGSDDYFGWISYTGAGGLLTLNSSYLSTVPNVAVEAGVVSAIPEPATTAMLLGAGALVMIYFKRIRTRLRLG